MGWLSIPLAMVPCLFLFGAGSWFLLLYRHALFAPWQLMLFLIGFGASALFVRDAIADLRGLARALWGPLAAMPSPRAAAMAGAMRRASSSPN